MAGSTLSKAISSHSIAQTIDSADISPPERRFIAIHRCLIADSKSPNSAWMRPDSSLDKPIISFGNPSEEVMSEKITSAIIDCPPFLCQEPRLSSEIPCNVEPGETVANRSEHHDSSSPTASSPRTPSRARSIRIQASTS